jgi:hypothetical protein
MGRVFLNAILGPPLGGAIIILFAFIEGSGEFGGAGENLGLLMLSYAMGIVPALVNGILAATIAHFLGRPLRLLLAPLTGAAVTEAFGVLMFGGMVNGQALGFVAVVGGLASLVCALIAESCPLRWSAGETLPKQ